MSESRNEVTRTGQRLLKLESERQGHLEDLAGAEAGRLHHRTLVG
jgi:hypothetical protein